ncbi:MAG: hypothetical protein ABEK84_01515 [Salinibacter sp.]
MSNEQGNIGTQIANPKALGFGVFAIALWMYSMVFANWPFQEGVMESAVAQEAVVLATFALLIAALAAFLRGSTWYAVFFMFWSAVFWASKAVKGGGEFEAYGGWFYLTLAVFTFLLWLGALQTEEVGASPMLVVLGAWITLLGPALTGLFGLSFFAIIGGYVGLVTALVSFWTAATEIDAFGGAPAA